MCIEHVQLTLLPFYTVLFFCINNFSWFLVFSGMFSRKKRVLKVSRTHRSNLIRFHNYFLPHLTCGDSWEFSLHTTTFMRVCAKAINNLVKLLLLNNVFAWKRNIAIDADYLLDISCKGNGEILPRHSI